MFDETLNAIVTGLAVGSVYGLIAIGYTVIFNATRVFNLAQGDLVMLGVLLSYFALDVEHWAEIVAFIFVIAGVVLTALVEERFVVRPFLRRPGDTIGWFVATLGFSLVIETVVANLYGDQPPQPVPSPLPSSPIHIGSVNISPQFFLAIASLIVVTVSVEYFYGHTTLGRAMRATANDRGLARIRGIEPTRMSMISFAIGGLIAAIGGFVIAPVTFANVSLGLTFGLYGFIALAIGGFGSIRGAVVGAWTLGIAEQLFDLYVNARFEVVADASLLVLVLVLRPTGLFGRSQGRTV
jgi:branched-chain amino acid transport system permease protein